ncbi:hypothetical protein GCM10027265_00980 [Jatrophihabitans fulvus]
MMPPSEQADARGRSLDVDVVLAVATYRRPDDLVRCLRSLISERDARARDGGERFTILIVDNDPDAGARAAVEGFQHLGVRYLHEPEPGISAARNRALDEAKDADVLVFVDDDEEVLPGWLTALLTEFERHRPSAVQGKVISDFTSEPDEWLRAGGFFVRRSLPTGTRVSVAATNNLLLDLHDVRRRGLRFEDSYGLTGGGDSAFTRRLVREGGEIRWCQEAVVVDHVPPDRATREWVLGRARRTGNSDVVVGLRLARGIRERTQVRVRSITRGLVRVAGGALLIGVGAVTRSTAHDARGHKALNRGYGMLTAAVGRQVSEYARTPATTRVLTSFPKPGAKTNPYIVQLARALAAEPGIELMHFSWRRALSARYDVVHVHWPEILLSGRTPLRRGARQLLFLALVLRWRMGRVAVVRTVHNVAPHERPSVQQRALLALLERSTDARIVLNDVGDSSLIGRSVVVPHGDYSDWFAEHRVDPIVPGRLAFVGHIRPYKNVLDLMTAFHAVTDASASLSVAGQPASEQLGLDITAAAASDRRITVNLEFLSDAQIASEIGRAQVAVFPYSEMENSGAVLLALSLCRRVLVPDNAVNRALSAEVGPGWILTFPDTSDPAVRRLVLAEALERALATPRPEAAAPDLSARSWDGVGARHAEIYRDAIEDRRSARR